MENDVLAMETQISIRCNVASFFSPQGNTTGSHFIHHKVPLVA